MNTFCESIASQKHENGNSQAYMISAISWKWNVVHTTVLLIDLSKLCKVVE